MVLVFVWEMRKKQIRIQRLKKNTLLPLCKSTRSKIETCLEKQHKDMQIHLHTLKWRDAHQTKACKTAEEGYVVSALLSLPLPTWKSDAIKINPGGMMLPRPCRASWQPTNPGRGEISPTGNCTDRDRQIILVTMCPFVTGNKSNFVIKTSQRV